MGSNNFKYYAKLYNKSESISRLFEILDYRDGQYYVYIDFVFPMNLKRITVRQENDD